MSDNCTQRTQELYDSLPQNKSERMIQYAIRDEIIDINYPFFMYAARKSYIKNTTVDFEDKLQCALLHFCKIWWRYKWDGTGNDTNMKVIRSDIAFSSFFLPRLTAYIRSDLQEVSYTSRRTVMRKIASQLSKKWTEVKLEDIAKANLTEEEMCIAQAVLNPLYKSSIEYEELFIHSISVKPESMIAKIDDNYDSITELLIHETIEKGCKLEISDLKYLSEILDISIIQLSNAYPNALEILVDRLKEDIEYQKMFYDVFEA